MLQAMNAQGGAFHQLHEALYLFFGERQVTLTPNQSDAEAYGVEDIVEVGGGLRGDIDKRIR